MAGPKFNRAVPFCTILKFNLKVFLNLNFHGMKKKIGLCIISAFVFLSMSN